MITISPLAAEKLAAYLAENKIQSPVRINVANGCGGPSLGLALDTCNENDHVHEAEGFTLVMSPDLAKECGRVTVDFVEKTSGGGCGGGGGFSLTPEKPLAANGGGCGASCSSRGCGC